jgi:hypothetical protein
MADINSPDYILSEDNPANYPNASALATAPARCHSYTKWTDPLDGEEHNFCPEFIQSVREHLEQGYGNRLLADELLQLLGMAKTSANRRQLRTALLILRRFYSIPVVSVKASGGGYFVAETQDECDTYNETQRRLAMSILRGTMSACWKIA